LSGIILSSRLRPPSLPVDIGSDYRVVNFASYRRLGLTDIGQRRRDGNTACRKRRVLCTVSSEISGTVIVVTSVTSSFLMMTQVPTSLTADDAV
jgi:hypothetical protein